MTDPAVNTRPQGIVLLDLGGVLADLGDPVRSMRLDMPPERFWATWLGSPAVRAYETGALSTAGFAREMAPELGLESAAAFAACFARWQLEPYPGLDELVRSITRDVSLCLLSNTNEVHWQQIESRTRIFDTFDRLFLSFQTRRYKPQESAYVQVVEHFQCAPGDILFLDDNEINVRAARSLGLLAERVDGPEGAVRALRQAGLSRD